MTLVLEIEYLSGVSFAAQGPEGSAPDWPPQPDRVFSALVASWGARGNREAETSALKWLESQTVPSIAASQAFARTTPITYVPPNDPKTGRSGNASVLPDYRGRQPRRFPAARPHSPIVRFYWEGVSPDPGTLASLDRLAADTAYVGHSSSLTRCRFLRSDELPEGEFEPATRRVYPGRLEELRRDYARFIGSNAKIGRPQPGDYVTPGRSDTEKVCQSYFSSKWLVLEHIDGEMPDIRAAALVAKEIRDTLLSGYRQSGKADSIPSEVSGHNTDGRPTEAPHLAIVPLAFAGFPYADGRVLGFALVPPRGSALFKDDGFLTAMRKIAPMQAGRRALEWHESRATARLRSFGLKLSPTFDPDPSKKSLLPGLYTKPANVFSSVTPIILDRHLKKDGCERQEEIENQIKAACRNLGLPEPRAVRTYKHSAIEGAPSAQPSGRAPDWMRWRLPSSLASRFLTHAVIQFPVLVEGPVILGAGRFVGLGLCRAMAGPENAR